MVLEAGQSQSPPEQAMGALSELCRIYWRPIFQFLRRQGFNPHDAQDLTQGFFAHLIESRAYARADREKGRFRSFLLGALKHFVAHARAHDRTLKARRRDGARRVERSCDRRSGSARGANSAKLDRGARLRARMGGGVAAACARLGCAKNACWRAKRRCSSG